MKLQGGSLLIKKIALLSLVGFYAFAGVNHFINPSFYLPLIPPYFPNTEVINIMAGIAEVLLALGLLYNRFLKLAAYGIIIMLFAFVPSHVYFIQLDCCVEGGLCTPQWVGWARLLLIHPLLIIWVWWLRNYKWN